MCCSNAFCTYDNNVENMTEVGKKANFKEEMLVRQSNVGSAKGGKPNDAFFENVDVLSDSNKKKQFMQDLAGGDELKLKL